MADPPRPVVLVHGLIGSLQVPDLLHHFPAGRALAPDLLGYGALHDVPPSAIGLSAQVDHLRRTVERYYGDEPVHAVGHSVGGSVVKLFAHAHPERVASVVSVEGNFTLKDAFWTSSVARMQMAEVDAMLSGFRDDPRAWLEGSGIIGSADTLAVARHWLAHQPATTVRAMAESVVGKTGSPLYPEKVRAVFDRHPVHLMAGERSANDWDVPDWARDRAASYTVIPGTGHLPMLERPDEFAASLRTLVHGR